MSIFDKNVKFKVLIRRWANDLFISHERSMSQDYNDEKSGVTNPLDLDDFFDWKFSKNHFFYVNFLKFKVKKVYKKWPDSFLTPIFRFLTPKTLRIDALKDANM